MGLKIVLSWKNKENEPHCVGGESSKDFGEDEGIMYALGVYPPNYQPGTELLLYSWGVPIIQQFFKHQINIDKYDYRILFVSNC